MRTIPRFYTDVHIAIEAVFQLHNKSVDIVHCGELGLSDADDSIHLQYAIENERVMVSCDRDFETAHNNFMSSGKVHSGIVYFRMKDQCQSISVIVKEIWFLHEAADYDIDLANQLWRVQ